MLVQLHWQNRADVKQTEFVAQGEFDDATAMGEWAKEIIDRRANEMPAGWVPLICNEQSEYFVWAAPDSIVSIEKTRG